MSSTDVGQTNPPEEQSTPTRKGALAQRFDGMLDWLEGAGFGFTWAERITYWVKHYGVVKALGIVLAVTFPLLKFVWLPYMGSRTAETLAEGVGLNLTVGDWSADLFDLQLTAHDIVIKSRGNYGQPEILRADSASFDLSVARRLRTGDWIDDVTVERPTLYLERQISGRWNWEDVVEASGGDALQPATGGGEGNVRYAALPAEGDDDPDLDEGWRLSFPHVKVSDLRIQWVENLPGRSGAGLIQSAQSTLFVDGVEILAENVPVAAAVRGKATTFAVRGRTADGRIEIKGAADFRRLSTGAPVPRSAPANPAYRVATASAGAPKTPSLTTSLYLENVGVAALGRMVPALSIVPTAGTVTGKINLALVERDLACNTDLVLTNVTYVVDPESPAARGRIEVIQRGLKDFRANGRVLVGCGGQLDDENYRPLNAIQTKVTREAVKTAPPVVRQAAALDVKQFSDQVTDDVIAGVGDAVSAKVAEAAVGALGRHVGGAVAKSFTAPTSTSPAGSRSAAPATKSRDNPVSGGVKKIGSGIKGLFSKKKGNGG